MTSGAVCKHGASNFSAVKPTQALTTLRPILHQALAPTLWSCSKSCWFFLTHRPHLLHGRSSQVSQKLVIYTENSSSWSPLVMSTWCHSCDAPRPSHDYHMHFCLFLICILSVSVYCIMPLDYNHIYIMLMTCIQHNHTCIKLALFPPRSSLWLWILHTHCTVCNRNWGGAQREAMDVMHMTGWSRNTKARLYT